MAKDFTRDLQKVFKYTREEAARLGNREATLDHIFLALLRSGDGDVCGLLSGMGVNIEMVRGEMDSVLREPEPIPYEQTDSITFSSDIDEFYRNVSQEISRSGVKSPSMVVVLLAILKNSGTIVAPILARSGVNYDSVKKFRVESLECRGVEGGKNNLVSGVKKSVDETSGEGEAEMSGETVNNSKCPADGADNVQGANAAAAAQSAKSAGRNGGREDAKSNVGSIRASVETDAAAGSQASKNLTDDDAAEPQRPKTPNLDKFGVDLTAMAAGGKLDPVVGREREIERLLQVLVRRKKNNPVLLGEAGVGKTAIVEGLAQRIVDRQVPRTLLGKRLVTIDMGGVVAGTKYRGQFEERMRGIVEELKASKDVIVFIDEIHTLVGAGAQAGSLDAANLLKPALSRGEIQCIGATTLDEFRKVIEKDGALERRFQKILVEPTDFDQTLAVLEGLRPKYEKFHNVKYSDAALRACVTLSGRYITDRMQPDKAIDVMDEAGARLNAGIEALGNAAGPDAGQLEKLREAKRSAAASGDFKEAARLRESEQALLGAAENALPVPADSAERTLQEENIASVVSMMTNIPIHRVSATEGERLLSMSDNLKRQIVGQDEAVSAVVRAIQRNRAGLRDPGKPVGTFIFLGPTGVGKTFLAKKLAEYMFDSEDNLIRVDMSEYMEKYSVSSLIGAPPGYVGYDQGGQLSEQVRRKPYSVVLFDEIEKAHPDIFNLLLQVLDEGRLTDAAGRKVDFRNTILILTSNIGSRQASELGGGIGFKTATDEGSAMRQNIIIEKALRRKFSPEFLNRIDDRILFNPLSREDVDKILDIELEKFYSRVSQMGYSVEVTAETRDKILDEGYDPEYGARPLKRAIQKYLEDPLAERILAGEVEGLEFRV